MRVVLLLRFGGTGWQMSQAAESSLSSITCLPEEPRDEGSP